MIDMDYEKAYKAVLQTATQWIKDGCTDKEKICLECVFPELRESEDEGIRKGLVRLLTVAGEAYLVESTGIKKESYLAYLEKQKEQKPAEWSEEDERYINGLIGLIEDMKVGISPKLRGVTADRCIAFLKSLRPSWKPNEEQMEAFRKYIEDFQTRAEAAVGGWNNFDVMIQLYEQLKKL